MTVLPVGRLAKVRGEVGSAALKGYLFALFAEVAAREGPFLLRDVVRDDQGDRFWAAAQRAVRAG